MNILLLVGTVLGVGVLGFAALVSLIMSERLRAALLGGAATVCLAAYIAGVVIVSLASHEELLPVGETKYFCGFYFDCHVGVTVLRDDLADSLGSHRASGTFHTLTLRFESSARRETLSPWRVLLELEDISGRRYHRDLAAEEALEGARDLEHPIAPGGSYLARVVYDVPAQARGLRLFADQGPRFKIPEILLVGDEGSVLHRKTYLAL